MLVPNIPETSPVEGEGGEAIGGGEFGEFGGVDQAAYTLTFFHAALIQAVCAGFVAGQLGEGSLRDGAKHAAIMLTVAYFVFAFLSSPIASVNPGEIGGEDAELIIDDEHRLQNLEEASLSEGGFVAVYASTENEDLVNGTLLGHSEYLEPGSHSDITIQLNETALNETLEDQTVEEAFEEETETRLRLVAHLDTNDSREFEFEGPWLPDESQVDEPYGTPSEGGEAPRGQAPRLPVSTTELARTVS